MAQKVFEDKEFHGSVRFFGVTVIDTVGSLAISGGLTINDDLIVKTGDIIIDALEKLYLDGGANTYLTEASADQIDVVLGGVIKQSMKADYTVFGLNTNYPAVMNELPSSTNPVFIPAVGDQTTGIGSSGSGVLNLIASAINMLTANSAGITMPKGYQTSSQQVEPTNSDGSSNTILPNTRNVEVIAPENDANDWILLPDITIVPIGHQIIIACNGASAFELRTTPASNTLLNSINADGDALEYACIDEEIITVTKLSNADGWVATGTDNVGAITTPVIPD